MLEKSALMMRVAQAGYEGYCQYTGNKSLITGEDMPEWDKVPNIVKDAWYSVADSIIIFLASLKSREG
jgi:hypothetical protein